MKAKHQRLIFVAISLGCLCAATLLAMQAFRDNVVFFYTPSELDHQRIQENQRIRIGGLVETGSVRREGDDLLYFRITDGTAALETEYHGMPPGLFREGQGLVAEGYLKDRHFKAVQVLTKHDEYYMPKEVVEALKKSGRWREGKAR